MSHVICKWSHEFINFNTNTEYIMSNNREKFVESVNSYHNQVLENCPDSFKVLAKSDDGNLEAMVHKYLPWEAWMWHPERETVFVKNFQERFKDLVHHGK